MSVTRLQDLQYRCIDTINAIVMCEGSEEDRHRALALVREHLESRSEQTKPAKAEGWLE